MNARVYIDTRDWWIGYYRGDRHHYICPLPTVVVRWRRRSRSTTVMGRDEALRRLTTERERIDREVSQLLRDVNHIPGVNHARLPLSSALRVLRDPHAAIISTRVRSFARPDPE